MAAVDVLPPSPITGKALTAEEAARGRTAGRTVRTTQALERQAHWDFVNQITDGLNQEQFGQLALATSITIGLKVLTDAEMSSLDASRYSQAAEVWFKMHRLATNQSTSNSASLHGSVDADALSGRLAEATARLAELQAGGPDPGQDGADPPANGPQNAT